MVINNFDQLATTHLRKQALLIAEAGLQAIATRPFLKANLGYNQKSDTLYIKGQTFKLKSYKRVIVVGFGKVALQAATELEDILGTRITTGLVIDTVQGNLKHITSKVGTLPLSSVVNVSATQELVKVLETCSEQDLVLCIVSGGGNSLLTWPANMPSEHERDITQSLKKSGATTKELSTVRKHISLVKGGQLARMAYPAKVISLIFSDVPGNDIALVADGPTVKDTTTTYDAMEIMDKYQTLSHCNLDSCGFVETPKEDKYFENVENILLCSSEDALKAMQDKAYDLGFTPKIWSQAYEGEAKLLGQKITTAIKSGDCLLAVGKSTVMVGSESCGVGGRNQELALSAAVNIQPNTLLLSMASNGQDNSNTAGALVDTIIREKIEKQQVFVEQSLSEHNTYQLALDLEAAIVSGDTGSDISDLTICLKF